MAHIICVIGYKGGTGKTTVSHLLAQGLGLNGQSAACVLTDVGREPLDPTGRRYLIADARSGEALIKVVQTLRTLEGWIGVIDGGANRPETDDRLSRIADLVLIPFRDSQEDLRCLVRDLVRFPQAWALPSQWPTNPWQREASERMLSTRLGALSSRVLPPVPMLSASKLLLQKELPAALPFALKDTCRRLAAQVTALLPERSRSLGMDAPRTALSDRSGLAFA